MEKVLNVSLDEIPIIAKDVTKTLKGGEIFALVGALGSGKTAFVKAVGKNLKLKHLITSPSFALLHAFPIKLKSSGEKIMLYHLDLYRTKSFKEAAALGLTEFWGRPNTVTFIEWADKIKKHLPAKTKIIKFKGK